MTSDRIDQIRARVEKASPGPWESHMLGGGKGGPNHYSVRIKCDAGNSDAKFAIARVHPQQNAATKEPMLSGRWNARFIAESRIDIPFLLSELSRLQAENDRFRKALEEIVAPYDITDGLETYALKVNLLANKALSAPVAGEKEE